MKQVIAPGPRTGRVIVPGSKSQAHLLLIAAALGRGPTELFCRGLSRDIAATARCLEALGASVQELPGGLRVSPIRQVPAGLCRLPCGESGSTLRFLMPLVGALGVRAVFLREGRLPQRPLAPFEGELTRMGMKIESKGKELYCEGKLRSGEYFLPGDVSSQYVTALLMALPLAEGESRLLLTGKLESAGYVRMTEQVLEQAGIQTEGLESGWHIPGGQRYALPQSCTVEGDYSSAAFFLALGALSPEGVRVEGLDPNSRQGDRAMLTLLERFGAQVRQEAGGVLVRGGRLRGIAVDGSQIPDLIPALAVVAQAAEGETLIAHAERLRLKESDRIASTCGMIRALGGWAEELADGLLLRGPQRLAGGTAPVWGDHRIAMAAAVAAAISDRPVTVENAACTAKSYPAFWEDLARLKGV